jgi:hypothetical protein
MTDAELREWDEWHCAVIDDLETREYWEDECDEPDSY